MSDQELRPPETEFMHRMRGVASLRILSWQAIAVFLAVSALSIGVVAIVRIAKPGWKPNPVVVFVLIVLATLQIAVQLAYRRGLRDARADAERGSKVKDTGLTKR